MKNMRSTTTSRSTGRLVRKIVAAAAAVFCLQVHSAASASVIADVTGCVGLTCTIEPSAGPVDVNPAGFTLDVDWSQILRFFEDPGGHGFMTLFFDYTGTHDTTEFFGSIAFRDPSGNLLPAVGAGFDDSSAAAGILAARFEVFGPESLLGGFSLGPSDGSGVDTLRWTSATIFPAQIEPVPEPSTLLLIGAGFAAAAWRRRTAAA